MMGFVQESSEIIGFVVACAFASAIDREELKRWCTEVVIASNSVDKLPGYIFDLAEFDRPLKDIYEVIGFVPSWQRSDDEDDALIGIAAYRNRLPPDATLNSREAKRKLHGQPKLLERFQETFPFIKFIEEGCLKEVRHVN